MFAHPFTALRSTSATATGEIVHSIGCSAVAASARPDPAAAGYVFVSSLRIVAARHPFVLLSSSAADRIEACYLRWVRPLRRADVVLELKLESLDASTILHKGAEAHRIGIVVDHWPEAFGRRAVMAYWPQPHSFLPFLRQEPA